MPDDRPESTPPTASSSLYFFPEAEVTEAEVRAILDHGPSERRHWVISNLLRYAQWGDIWSYVSRDEVRDCFHDLDLPPNLRAAWGRLLKVEAPTAV
ncbi:MAG: hypothetical protein K8J08_11330 [Thermoanaerobaculia bacterium]|nr:hypothetical protein [Thermoanaerobaculia bacterium]